MKVSFSRSRFTWGLGLFAIPAVPVWMIHLAWWHITIEPKGKS